VIEVHVRQVQDPQPFEPLGERTDWQRAGAVLESSDETDLEDRSSFGGLRRDGPLLGARQHRDGFVDVHVRYDSIGTAKLSLDAHRWHGQLS